MRFARLLIPLAVLVFVAWYASRHGNDVAPVPPTNTQGATAPDTSAAPSSLDAGLPAFLPTEARATLAMIARGGPFPHAQDGVVFGNYEGRLPQEPRGFYHEYTVETPGAGNRGARRIITGGNPPVVYYYYTDDHYRSFRQFEVPR
ncbi:MAG TPA: ribonuclease domain-containing protein [Rhodanobacteraceae bacterium]|nr:ribonuclease domain-containing protein [Rhodanobacteraceae bacterium]